MSTGKSATGKMSPECLHSSCVNR